MRIKPVPVLQNKSRRYHAAAATQSLAYYSTPKPIIRRSRTSAGQRVGHGALSAVITRGSYGVPSVYASSMRGVWFGDGWAQAADRMAQLELTRRTVEGTLSGIFGPAELAQDEDVRTFFYTAAELQAQYDSMPAVTRGALSDFAAGINAYEGSAYACAASEQANVPYEFFALGRLMGLSGPYRPAPWSAVDTVAVGNYLSREFGGGGGSELQDLSFLNYLNAELAKDSDASAAADAVAVFNDARWINDPTAPTTVPGPPAPAMAPPRGGDTGDSVTLGGSRRAGEPVNADGADRQHADHTGPCGRAGDRSGPNEGNEYWGTIYRSTLISQLLRASTHITVGYLEQIEHAIGTIDDTDDTRPAAPYFIPYLIQAYRALAAAHSPLTDPAAHPDLAPAIAQLARWNGVTTLGSPAMSIFMNFLEAFERNVFEGGLAPGEQYTGTVNLSDASLGLATFGGLGGMGTYNFLFHILAGTRGLVPCGTLCYGHGGGYLGGHQDELLVESLNGAITILSGTGTQLGQDVPGFGTTDIADWGYRPALNADWDSLDPLAAGVTTHCGASPAQNRSTFMMAVDVGPVVTGQDLLPPGESGFISAAGVPSPHFCDQVSRFDDFTYKPMPRA